mgnify:CR=1 FL=1
MGQILLESARTTEATRRAIQNSQESIAALAERYDLNPKTVAKWKKRDFVHDAAMGPKEPRSTTLSLPITRSTQRASASIPECIQLR